MDSGKLNSFKETLDRIDKEITTQNSCISTLTIIAIAAPFVVWILLYLVKPSFVKNELDEKSTKKMITWTIIFTVVIWAVLFGYSYFTGNVGTLACLSYK